MPKRFLFAIALFTLTLISAVGCTGTPDTDTSGDPPALNAQSADAVVPVKGMSCPLCAENIQRQLAFDSRIAGSRVDMGTGNVYIDFAAGQTVPADDLAKAIDNAGFTPGEVLFPAQMGGEQ